MKSLPTIAGKVAFVLFIIFLTGASCTKTEKVDSANCFSDNPLETIPWAKKQLESFQHPKSGLLDVSVFNYKGNYVLVFANVFASSPHSYMFDCAGDLALDKLGVTYNEFYDQAKRVKVLLKGTY